MTGHKIVYKKSQKSSRA